MGILFSVLAGPIFIYWIYRKVAAKYPALNEFIYRFCGSLMILGLLQFVYSNAIPAKSVPVLLVSILSAQAQNKIPDVLNSNFTNP